MAFRRRTSNGNESLETNAKICGKGRFEDFKIPKNLFLIQKSVRKRHSLNLKKKREEAKQKKAEAIMMNRNADQFGYLPVINIKKSI